MNSPQQRVVSAGVALVMLWLLGACLRVTVLAVPPVLVLIQSDLGLSATAVGVLANLPVAMFALAALPGALLVARLGLLRTLIAGLSLVAIGSACRGIGSGTVTVYLSTAVMGAGVAILQPALPACVRLWAPQRIGFATAVYTNGLLVSEALPVLLTLPVILPWLGGWRADLVFWSIPVAVIASLVSRFAPRDALVAAPATTHARAAWWPKWSDPLIWRLALLFVGINSLYFGTNAFFPVVLNATGRSEWIGLGLFSLNFAQIPASLLLLRFAQRIEQRAWPYAACGVLSLVGIAAIVFGGGISAVVGASCIGFSGGAGLILALTLPALLAPPALVARTSAAVFTISYSGAMVVAVLCGLAWDRSGHPLFAFGPLAVAALALILACAIMWRRGELR